MAAPLRLSAQSIKRKEFKKNPILNRVKFNYGGTCLTVSKRFKWVHVFAIRRSWFS
jgi:hypothetical protein